MTAPHSAHPTGTRQPRPSVADLLAPLRLRLPLLVALVLSIAMGAVGYWELRVFEAGMTADLVETARATGQAVADDIEVGEEPSKA